MVSLLNEYEARKLKRGDIIAINRNSRWAGKGMLFYITNVWFGEFGVKRVSADVLNPEKAVGRNEFNVEFGEPVTIDTLTDFRIVKLSNRAIEKYELALFANKL
jgi:hypothetical protein